MQDTPKVDKPFSKNSFVLHRNFEAVQYSDKLKPLRHGPFNNLNKLRISLMNF